MDSPPAPFFSVVIPTYNRAGFIQKAINSVLAQTDPDFEVLVIDDGSTDHTAEVVQAIADPRLHYHYQPNAERGAARNHGARIAKGQYICFLDSDDYWLPLHLATARTFIQATQAPKCHHLAFRIDAPDGRLERLQQPTDLSIKALAQGNLLSCNAVVIPKSVLEQFPFSENRALSGSEDYALWLHIAAHKGWLSYEDPVTSVIVNDANVRGSLDNASIERLLTRLALLRQVTKEDSALQVALQPYYKRFSANLDFYAALHLAMGRHKRHAFRYWLRALAQTPGAVAERRSLAVVKWLLLPYRTGR